MSYAPFGRHFPGVISPMIAGSIDAVRLAVIAASANGGFPRQLNIAVLPARPGA